MLQTISYKVNDRIVVVEKCGTRIAAVLRDEFVIVVSLKYKLNEQPFIPLAKKLRDKNDAYYTWTHVIGKMINKDGTSKYFDNPKLKEHLLNGNVEFTDYPFITHVVEESVRVCNDALSKL